MSTTEKLGTTERMMRLFEGFTEAYGTYRSTTPNANKGGKLEIKASARTVRSEVTVDLWQKHLDGEEPIGIIPIRSNNTCLWGVIDIDTYDISHSDLVDVVEKNKLPLILCRSKSGGAHLFLFLAEPIAAEIMQLRLRDIAALIGHGGAEVFPKQRSMQADRGDLGSWLNMPYFGGDESDRYAMKQGGLGMTLEEFLDRAESLQQPAVYLEKHDFRLKPKKDPEFGDGPPCMQHLAASGFPEGMRNKGMFALALFARRKFAANWQEVVERWNYELFQPPLPASEVVDIIRRLDGPKDYHYTCREHPLSAHCNSTLCRTRKYGVGGDDDLPVISGLTVLDTDPPLWFVDVDSERLELSTDELQQYRLFHKVCMERLHRCFKMLKQDQWLNIIGTAMRDVVTNEAPPEVGRRGQFYELLEEYLTNRHKGETMEDLFLGRPFEKDGIHYFRLADLQKFLDLAGFKIYNRGQITARIRDLGGDSKFINLKGKGLSCWFVPSKFRPMPQSDTPPILPEPI